MFFSQKTNIRQISYTIDGKKVEQVTSFQYLRTVAVKDGHCQRRIGIAKRKFSEMAGLLASDDLSLPPNCGEQNAMLVNSHLWI